MVKFLQKNLFDYTGLLKMKNAYFNIYNIKAKFSPFHFTVLLVLFLASSTPVFAGQCLCNDKTCPPLKEKYLNSQLVFLGEIITVKQIETNNYPLHEISLKVIETFKGNPLKSEKVYTRHTPLDTGDSLSIDIDIDIGTQYIIFKPSLDKPVLLTLCPTFHESPHFIDLNKLREINKVNLKEFYES